MKTTKKEVIEAILKERKNQEEIAKLPVGMAQHLDELQKSLDLAKNRSCKEYDTENYSDTVRQLIVLLAQGVRCLEVYGVK